MHNEYVRICCILNEKDKLALLKYRNIDITETSNLLYQITLDLFHQCQNHVAAFYNDIKKENRKYARMRPEFITELQNQVNDQLIDMAFVEAKYCEYFSKRGKKTKEDLLTYVLASQITDRYYNEYLFRTLVMYLKQEMGKDFWVNHGLYHFEIGNIEFPEFSIMRDKKEERKIGRINHNLNYAVTYTKDYMNNYFNGENALDDKLDYIKKISPVLNNYYDMEYNEFNTPYQDAINDLVDHIKVSIDLDKPKKLIKRI